MYHDVYAWKAPRDLEPAAAATLIADWSERGGDPAASPFEPSGDVAWFCRELARDAPRLVLVSDAKPEDGSRPIWLQTEPAPPARVVAIRMPLATRRDELDAVFGLAAKYDLVVFDPRAGRLHLPLDELAEHATATFWPGGAVRAAVAGGAGGLVAAGAWSVGIPIVSGVVALAGGFLFVMGVATFIDEGRKLRRRRATRGR